MENWISYLIDNGKSENTVKSYISQLKKFEKWFVSANGEDLIPEKVTPTDLREYKSFLQTVKKQKANTINLSINAMRSWLKFYGQEIAVPSFVNKQKSAPKSLDKHERQAYIRAVERGKDKRDTAIIYLMLYAGLRISEVVALNIEDLKLGERSGSARVVGKGDKERNVPLNKTVRQALTACIGNRQTGPVFINSRSYSHSRLGVSGAWRIVKQYAYNSRIPNLHPHTLRHTFAKNLLDSGHDITVVAQILGHESIQTTAIYTVATERDLQKAVEDIDC